MPYCPRCKFEYRAGMSRCPECGEALREGSPPEVQRAAMVRLRKVTDPSEADVIQAVLAESGIPAFVRRHGPITGELSRVTNGMTEDYAIVLVPEDRLAEAEGLLEEIESGEIEWPEGMEPDEGEEDE